MDNTSLKILPSLRWSPQQISRLHLSLSVVCSPVTPDICPLNLHIHESSLLLHGARTSSFQIPSILLTPSVDLNIFSRASCLFVGVIISKHTWQQVHYHLVGFPFTPAATPKMQQNICLSADHLHLDFIADILTNQSPFRVSTCHIFVEMHLWFCGFVGKCNSVH